MNGPSGAPGHVSASVIGPWDCFHSSSLLPFGLSNEFTTNLHSVVRCACPLTLVASLLSLPAARHLEGPKGWVHRCYLDSTHQSALRHSQPYFSFD